MDSNPQQSINAEVCDYFSRAIKKLLAKYRSMFLDKKAFWNEFYDYIDNTKPILLENESLTPDSLFFDEIEDDKLTYDRKKEKIDFIFATKPIEYYCILTKFIFEKIHKKYTIVFVYDDIEAKPERYHKCVIEIARHIHSCLCATKGNFLTVKSIVSLRAYTFRCNVGRISDARREYLESDTIIKDKPVELHKVFEKRFREIEKLEGIKESIKDVYRYKEAKFQLEYVENQLNKIGSNLICSLCNDNLCDSMILYCKVMTNLVWIACNEEEYNGAFTINSQNYRLTSENIIYAIAMGNNNAYLNNYKCAIPNLLSNQTKGTELFSLYIIKYFINKEYTALYGEKHVNAKDIVSDLMSVFSKSKTIDNYDYWYIRIHNSLQQLYSYGVLSRSLYDIEDTEEKQFERIYNDKYKLYLSPKGKSLFELFSKNAVLLELYRDDIYTDIPNNDMLTSQLNTNEIFEYLLEYLGEYFIYEKQNIGYAIPNLDLYIRLIGSEFITSLFLEGVVKNIITYYKSGGEDYNKLLKKALSIVNDMKTYAKTIYEKYTHSFCVSKYLLKQFDEITTN